MDNVAYVLAGGEDCDERTEYDKTLLETIYFSLSALTVGRD